MRVFIVLLMCLMLVACGKTGALYLPEKPQTQTEQPEQPEQNTQLQGEQSQSQDTGTGGNAD